ncbi:Sialidase-1 [Liparis tanakae]|uniref:Sialidase-1 n=1 Tax=Liparis tanakae TaxID=230148 RepID=A0A4Z2H2B4_9TELE|nr:Sialidase-1 [Liparis tanakae]
MTKRYNPAKGRLVVCGHGTLKANGVFCILSDDHGQNWYNGGSLKSIPYNQDKKAQDFSPDECQPVELTDGSIVINVRNQNSFHCRCRMVVRSHDGGLTLPVDSLYFDHELVDPAVAAGALVKNGVLFFTNPANEQHTMQIWAGPSGYSSMTSLDSGSADDKKYIFVIYEKGHMNYDETIAFAKIHLFGGR